MTDQSWRPSRRGETGSRIPRVGVAARMRRDWWWIAILVLAGSFQLYRGAPVDGVFFLAAGLALLADAGGWLRALDRYPLPRLHLAAQVTLGAVAVAVITFAPQFGLADLITVAVIGATALIVAWRDDPLPSDPAPNREGRDVTLRRALRRSAVLWSAAGIFLCLWELGSFFLAMPSAQADFDHPPLSDLLDPIVANPVGRAACAAIWLIAGAAFLRRGRRS
ncbi:hypothetical protein [Humibacter sp. RRB41]|uniref:hypothetical protein n=1 Tax=Humibacter sp. RRB41 TaxID=2919946 RepID=UPI001FAA99B3|nr:hypothetical protein [Humibacter sp. RRB41]